MGTTTPFRSPAAEEAVGVGAAWSLTGNITANDANPRTVTFTGNGETSQELRAYSFGFDSETPAIPDDAVIVGVEVLFLRSFDEIEPDGHVQDNAVRLVIDDGAGGRTTTGDVRTMAGSWAQGAFQVDTIGGSADDWGAGLTGVDVKNANFGVSLKAKAIQNFADFDTFEVLGKVDLAAISLTWEQPSTGVRGRTRLRNAVVYEVV